MDRIVTDYPVEALALLLDKDCLIERYHPLVPYRGLLLTRLPALGCHKKSDAAALSDDALLGMGIPDGKTVMLLRRFFTLYDPDPKKFREIGKLGISPAERAAYWELYHLPGVRAVRAGLYLRAGYASLRGIADAAPEEIIEKTALTIRAKQLSCVIPLRKEVRTHIAVARAFLWNAAR